MNNTNYNPAPYKKKTSNTNESDNKDCEITALYQLPTMIISNKNLLFLYPFNYRVQLITVATTSKISTQYRY